MATPEVGGVEGPGTTAPKEGEPTEGAAPPSPPHVTKTGRILTEADCEALAEEAEAGYDIDRFLRDPGGCPGCSGPNFVGVEISKVYDGILYWWCTSCDHKWPRFPEGDWRYMKAAYYIIKEEKVW